MQEIGRIVFFTSSSSSSGGTRQAMYLARWLTAQGCECLFFVPEGSTIVSKEPCIDWRFLDREERKWKSQISSAVQDRRTIVHFFHGRAFKLASLWGIGSLGRRAGLVVNRGVTFFPKNPFPYWSPGIDAFVVNSNACAAQLRQIFVPSSKINLVYNGVPDYRVKACAPRQQLCAVHDISEDALVFGAVAGNNPVKGVDSLLQAFADADLGREVFLVVTGIDRQKWEKRAIQLGIASQVRLVGFAENVGDYLNFFDVFVLSSLKESMPNTLIEAMLCAKPIVTSRAGGIAEVASDCALTYAPGNSSELAELLKQVAGSKSLRQQLSCKSKTKGSVFNMDFKGSEVFKVYKRVLEQKKW